MNKGSFSTPVSTIAVLVTSALFSLIPVNTGTTQEGTGPCPKPYIRVISPKAGLPGDRVEIRGFCSFFVKEYGAYTGRNPKTGERVKIAPKKLPFFKPGKELKERVDQ